MHSQLEKRAWPSFIPEIFKIQRDLAAKDLDELIKIAGERNPNQINLSVLEKAITIDGSPASIGVIDHFEFATAVTFTLNPKKSFIATYLENYPESKIPAKNNEPEDIEQLDEMKIRTILTGVNRKRQIQSKLPSIPIRMALIDLNGEIEINQRMLEYLYERNKELRLSPFII